MVTTHPNTFCGCIVCLPFWDNVLQANLNGACGAKCRACHFAKHKLQKKHNTPVHVLQDASCYMPHPKSSFVWFLFCARQQTPSTKSDVNSGAVGEHLYLATDGRLDGLLRWIISTFRNHPDNEHDMFER